MGFSMDDPKKCGITEFIQKLNKGAFVFIEQTNKTYRSDTGCRQCKQYLKTTYCPDCGSKVSENMQVLVKAETTSIRMSKQDNRVYMETRKPGDGFYGNMRPCDITLDYLYQNAKNLSWIWP